MESSFFKEIRVRIAPSPTGPFHVGNARTALFNWLFARKHGGKFILRIDDTDKERSKIEWENDILENLNWLGLNWDEGPIAGKSLEKVNSINQQSLELKKGYIGDFGPYHQSKRKDIYRKYLNYLLENNLAYRCFCKPEELKAEREAMLAAGQPPKYSGRCRSLTKEEVEEKLKRGEKYVIRIKTPEKKITFTDLIKGKITFDLSLIGDFIIAKSLDEPLYNFTTVIDDYEMKISHIIRGEDHISNTPKQLVIQEALGFPRPKYAHLPLIFNPDKTKLSKRQGGVSVREFREKGYLPEALLNFLALLGWHPEDDQEFLTIPELIEKFDLSRVQKSGAVFLEKKLDWLNSKHIRNTSLDRLVPLVKKYIEIPKYSEMKTVFDDEYLKKVIVLFQERITKLSEIRELSTFLFRRPSYSSSLLIWKDYPSEKIKSYLQKVKRELERIEERNWEKEEIEKVLLEISEKEKDRGLIFWPFRVALSGQKASPPPADIAYVLGKKETLERVKKAIDKLE